MLRRMTRAVDWGYVVDGALILGMVMAFGGLMFLAFTGGSG